MSKNGVLKHEEKRINNDNENDDDIMAGCVLIFAIGGLIPEFCTQITLSEVRDQVNAIDLER